MADPIFLEGTEPSQTQGEFPSSSIDRGLPAFITEQEKLKKEQDNKRKVLNFNNSSYSGVDIKVVVHKYETPTSDLSANITQAIAGYSQVQIVLLNLATNIIPRIAIAISQVKRGAISTSEFDRTITAYKDAVNQINTLESLLKDSGYMQFIGSALNGRLVDSQRNPTGLSAEILQMSVFLDSLISGWKQQSDALQSKSADFINTKTLAELQTISISTFREKTGVRAFGNVGVKGYTRGTRTVAGSMIFTVFDRNVLFELLETTSYDADDQFRAAIKDQLPPLDMTILFANEYGALSRMGLFGVEFVSEGQTMSIEDIILEDVCQFVARDVDPMTPVLNDQGIPYNVLMSNYNQAVAAQRSTGPLTVLRASDLRGSEWDIQEGKSSAAVDRFLRRSNPFF
jgi:hypothetical protein